jgi:hypothetical protein
MYRYYIDHRPAWRVNWRNHRGVWARSRADPEAAMGTPATDTPPRGPSRRPPGLAMGIPNPRQQLPRRRDP